MAVRANEIYAIDGDGAYTFNFKKPNLSVRQYKMFMRKTGLFDLISNHIVNNLVDYATGVETGLDSNGRKNRGGHLMENLVESFIQKSGFVKGTTYFKEMYIHQITDKWNIDLSAISNQGKMEKRFDFVVKTPNMIYGIETNFYRSGGSKLNETARSYKTLALETDTIDGFTFVWFTDGKGWNSAKNNLEETFDVMEHIYNINKELQYIFYSSKRLLLIVDEKERTYKLKVNGKSVKPNKISSGERNALALCYFFADIAKNMNADNPYSDEMFLVIDDPLSSFDYENKIGIISFLKYKIKNVLSGSDSTKAIIMTHDISFFMDFSKALEEISKYCNSIEKKATHQLLYLHNKSINEFMYRKQNEYTDLLTEIFEYANSDSVDENNTIGNQMRRVLEAFSTFSFKIGIEELSTKQDVLELLPTQELKDYFENLMYRLVLNGESHEQDTARFFPRTDFYKNLSPEEKQRTAKDILSFMYLLNKQHIRSHLNENTSVIEKWIDEISSFD